MGSEPSPQTQVAEDPSVHSGADTLWEVDRLTRARSSDVMKSFIVTWRATAD